MAPLLSFHRQIIEEIAPPEHDDLLIVAKGLGLRRIVCTVMKIYDSPSNLILLINATPAEETGIGELLSSLGVRRPGLRVLTHEMGSKERNELYLKGGLFSVTSRILVVDLLSKNVPPEMITGLMVLHAELVNQTSLEAFIVRLYRESNHEGFLKAFSDEPESFSATMTPLTTCLKQLSIRRVTLWPRYRDEVHMSLGQRKADVIELYQPLTPNMTEIQSAIVECMDATLAELRKSCSGIELDELVVDNALFKNFDRIVRGRLDPIWHRVGPKTKRLVQDLSTLRNLLNYLLTYDSITFNSYLEAILTSSTSMAGSSAAGKGRPDQSPWLYLDAANTLFHVAKRRAYLPPASKSQKTAIQQANADAAAADGGEDDLEALREAETQGAANAQASGSGVSGLGMNRWPPGVQPVLEELPKWGLLAGVLEEIEEEIEVMQRQGRTDMPGSNTVLVMASSDRTCTQLREYLATRQPSPAGADDGPSHKAGKRMMEKMLRSYFWWKGSLGEMNRTFRGGAARPKTAAGGSAGGAGGAGRGGQAPRGQPAYKRRRMRGDSVVANVSSMRGKGAEGREEAAEAREEGLEDEAEGIADFLHQASQQYQDEDDHDHDNAAAGPSFSSARSATPAPAFFREPSMARSATPFSGQPRAESEVPELRRMSSEAPSVAMSTASSSSARAAPPQALLRPSAQDSATDYFDPDGFDAYFGLLEPQDTIVVRPYKGEDEDQILDELRPRFIVMYDPDPAFIRRIEVYRSSNPGLGVRVYFMVYGESVEEQKYLSGIRKEKLAFERLIREKGNMIIPLSGDPRGAPTAPTSKVETLARAINTRMAGGATEQQAEPPTVIVDMREFRSTLPSILHAAHMLIIPVTLQVGDYILSPEMCVERKSIPDLQQSFASGRLYTQCETMSVHYKQPILLIEFEENKSFSLQSMIETTKRPTQFQGKKGTDPREDSISEHEIQSKLVLLTLTFPRLRIIWSPSPFATADIVADLKLNHSEPSVEKAVLVGQGDEGTEGDSGGSNGAAVDLLRLIPGVSARNLRHVMNNIDSIQHMCSLPKAELVKIMGAEQAGLAYSFLHKDVQRRT